MGFQIRPGLFLVVESPLPCQPPAAVPEVFAPGSNSICPGTERLSPEAYHSSSNCCMFFILVASFSSCHFVGVIRKKFSCSFPKGTWNIESWCFSRLSTVPSAFSKYVGFGSWQNLHMHFEALSLSLAPYCPLIIAILLRYPAFCACHNSACAFGDASLCEATGSTCGFHVVRCLESTFATSSWDPQSLLVFVAPVLHLVDAI